MFYSNFACKIHNFWDIRLVTIQWPWNQVTGHSRSSKSTRIDLPPMISLTVTMGLSHTICEIYGDFSRNSQNFPTPSIFCPHWRGSPWNWLPALGVRKLEWWGYWATKKFDDIFSRLDTMNARTWWTDGQTLGHRKRPHLRIASRGKNGNMSAQLQSLRCTKVQQPQRYMGKFTSTTTFGAHRLVRNKPFLHYLYELSVSTI